MTRIHSHLFPIVDDMIEGAVHDVEARGDKMSCRMGCDHCCHLLVEISWEEASELSFWLDQQPEKRQRKILARISESAANAREFLAQFKKGHKYADVWEGDLKLPDKAYDDYFYGGVKRPCPLLEDGVCSAYEARPTPCRLHMVTSPAENCSDQAEDAEDYEVPDELEEVKEDLGPVIGSLERDGRWGQFAIVLEANLRELSYEGAISKDIGKILDKLRQELAAAGRLTEAPLKKSKAKKAA